MTPLTTTHAGLASLATYLAACTHRPHASPCLPCRPVCLFPARSAWPGGSVDVSPAVSQVSGWWGRPTFLDLQRIANVINVKSQLTLSE